MTEQIVNSRGFNLNASQATYIDENLEYTIIQTPPVSLPNFGGSPFQFDLKNKATQYHELILQLAPSAITGLSGASSPYPHFIPASLWVQKIEYLVGGVVVNTCYGESDFVKNQLFVTDENRKLQNASMGDYLQPTSSLYALTSSGTGIFQIPLKSFINQTHFSVLTANHELQLRVYLKPLSQCLNLTDCTGTPSCTLNSTLIARVSYLPDKIYSTKLAFLSKTPRHYRFLSETQQTFQVQSGVNSTSVILTAFNGRCSHLFFFVRPTTGLSGSSTFQFTEIASFDLKNASGTSMVGGSVISSRTALTTLGKWWSKSSYLGDGHSGLANSNVFLWSFSSDPARVQQTGESLNSYNMRGSEVLTINFSSTLGSAVQIDCYGFMEAVIEQTSNGIKKITL